MHNLEAAIVAWFITKFGADDPELRRQLEASKVVEREFTSGGGVFLTLNAGKAAASRRAGEISSLDGPEIRTPEMSEGALVTLHFNGGLAGSFEIWSHAGDYPTDRHPADFILVEPKINHVDLRGVL